MIKINQIGTHKMISSSVSDFCDALGYCEYKIPFYIDGIKVTPSLETIQGIIAHSQEEKFEEEHFEFKPITVKELVGITTDIEFKREKIYTSLMIPLEIGNDAVLVYLQGRTDKIFRNNETLIVQDDKFPNKLEQYAERSEPYPSQMLQALTYLNSLFSEKRNATPDEFFEIPHSKKSWIIQIKDKNNGNKPFKIFKGGQSRKSLAYLHYSINRFAKLVLGAEAYVHHNSADKCRPCSFAKQCEYRV